MQVNLKAAPYKTHFEKALSVISRAIPCPDPKFAKDVLESAENARLFIISEELENAGITLPTDKDELFTLPFPICAFEFFSKNGIIKTKTQYNLPVEVVMFIVEEIGPKNFRFKALGFNDSDEDGAWFSEFSMRDDTGIWLTAITHGFCKLLSTEALAIEHTNIRFKIRNGSEKRTAKVKDIVHIRPKKNRGSKIIGVYGQEIDWSHRWEVAGHWRKIIGMGKDRENHYGVSGFTLVSEHVKGPENKLLVKKTRLMHGNPAP